MANKISIASTTHATATKEIKSTPMLSIVHLFRFYPYYYLLFYFDTIQSIRFKHFHTLTEKGKIASYLMDLISYFIVLSNRERFFRVVFSPSLPWILFFSTNYHIQIRGFINTKLPTFLKKIQGYLTYRINP